METAGPGISHKSRLLLSLLAWLVGYLAIDRFYLGQVGTGILKLVTFGGVGIWYLIDLILAVAGKRKDNKGLLIREWDPKP